MPFVPPVVPTVAPKQPKPNNNCENKSASQIKEYSQFHPIHLTPPPKTIKIFKKELKELIMTLLIQTGSNNPILRKKAKKVKKITAEIKRLISDMTETMEKAPGIGLAAPQVGWPLRLIIANPNHKIVVLVNPEIKKFSRKKIIMEEGCLSLPEQFYPLERPAKIKVEGLNQNSKKIKIKANGLLARIIQHEIDHLNGVLIVDKATNDI